MPQPEPQYTRIDARRNRERILEAARSAFAGSAVGSVSMAEIARRAGVGSATLYRNFPTRAELLEAIFTDRVDQICAEAEVPVEGSAGEALFRWLQLFFDFARARNDVVLELIAAGEIETSALREDRIKMCAAGRPLLEAARSAGDCGSRIDIGQILDALVHLARIPGDEKHVQEIVATFFEGIRR
ncbi:TetR family transcriptional regulator [Actinoplanes sp. NBRC 14428]|uniref:TetR family transcriptional regulator n=1 Tax=Pseudosporangium ferrugineum TaxID=439699 RepID=A0A2T0RHM3_9ACTN|nr:TetR/AcrR family transcriptional regulator [Pseudosporangium ferrugineum]PRY20600.1 TetR family transcriptional regulator [Pseudosporangium ferrugineum]BCJ51414.1 TetR family transcriptional regulator [Actinoplanes sp. NBRC 14428]